MRSQPSGRGRRKLTPVVALQKTQFTVMQTQSTVHQLLHQLNQDNENLENIKKNRIRKQSYNSIMSDNFDEIEDLSRFHTKKVSMDDKIELNIGASKVCLKKALVKQLAVVSSFQIKPFSLCLQTMCYYFQKIVRGMSFLDTKARKQKQKFSTIMMLLDIYKKYTKHYAEDFKFYVLYCRSLFCFTHNNMTGSANMITYSPDSGLSKTLTQQNIAHQSFPNIESGETLVVYDRNISVFWNYFMNVIIASDDPFQIISNFDFANATRSYAIEMFNGIENRQLFKNSKQFCNYNKLYRVQLQGILTQDNIKSIVKQLETQEGTFMLEIKYLEGSQQLERHLDHSATSGNESD